MPTGLSHFIWKKIYGTLHKHFSSISNQIIWQQNLYIKCGYTVILIKLYTNNINTYYLKKVSRLKLK